MDKFEEWWEECYCYTSCSKVDANFVWNSAIEAAENAVDAANHSDCDAGIAANRSASEAVFKVKTKPAQQR